MEMNRIEMDLSLMESHLVEDEKKKNRSKYTITWSRQNNPLQWLISTYFQDRK